MLRAYTMHAFYKRNYMRTYMRKHRERKGYFAGRDRWEYNVYMRKCMQRYRENKGCVLNA
jgi:hypothetical protein